MTQWAVYLYNAWSESKHSSQHSAISCDIDFDQEWPTVVKGKEIQRAKLLRFT